MAARRSVFTEKAVVSEGKERMDYSSRMLRWEVAGDMGPSSSGGKESACNAGDPGLIPGSGRSPGEGNGNPLQYSCLENSMDEGAWWATVHGVTKSWT